MWRMPRPADGPPRPLLRRDVVPGLHVVDREGKYLGITASPALGNGAVTVVDETRSPSSSRRLPWSTLHTREPAS